MCLSIYIYIYVVGTRSIRTGPESFRRISDKSPVMTAPPWESLQRPHINWRTSLKM